MTSKEPTIQTTSLPQHSSTWLTCAVSLHGPRTRPSLVRSRRSGDAKGRAEQLATGFPVDLPAGLGDGGACDGLSGS